jgi:nicotinamide-nucleotide amidase
VTPALRERTVPVRSRLPRVCGVVPQQTDQDVRTELAGRIAELAREQGLTVAVAESLTGGMLAQPLAAAPGASEWFRGALVAYSSEVKHDVLDVPPGPVVSAEAAVAMARGVRRLLGADLAVAVTGAGGPDPEDGRDPGTVFLAVAREHGDDVRRLLLDGDPGEILAATAEHALQMLVDALDR